MDRREFLAAAGMAGAGVALGAQARAKGQRSAKGGSVPNVLFVVSDDQPWFSMPHMPKTLSLMRDGGMEFTGARIVSPVCGVSRVTMLTGQYAHNHGIWEHDRLPERYLSKGLNASSVAVKLRDAGYRTGMIGKWLNGYERMPGRVFGGWNRWLATLGSRDPVEVNRDGKVGLARWHGGREVPEDRETDYLAEKTVEFVEGAAKMRVPWFCYAAIKAPHSPYKPSPRHAHEFDDEPLPGLPSFDRQGEVPPSARRGPLTTEEKAASTNAWRGKLEELQDLDDGMASLFDALDRTGQRGNTYVFYLTDNGHSLGAHREENKGNPYEESVRTPLLVTGPGIEPGSKSGALASNVDLHATILDIAGLPWDGTDGRSLLPLFSDPGAPFRENLLLEYDWKETWGALATRDRYYVERPDGEELYDLDSDPWQLSNLAGSRPEEAGGLKARLNALRGCAGEACRAVENP